MDDNPVNDTALVRQIQEKELKAVCYDDRCHANLPTSQVCKDAGVNSLSAVSAPSVHLASALLMGVQALRQSVGNGLTLAVSVAPSTSLSQIVGPFYW